MAGELGVDRIFGRGTTPGEVASYLVHALVTDRKAEGMSDSRVGLTVTHRRYVPYAHAHYAGNLVDGAYALGLFGDVATEVCIRTDGDEGLFASYADVQFLAPVRAGDVVEVTATVIRVGTRSRTIDFECAGGVSGAAGAGWVGGGGVGRAGGGGDGDGDRGRSRRRRELVVCADVGSTCTKVGGGGPGRAVRLVAAASRADDGRHGCAARSGRGGRRAATARARQPGACRGTCVRRPAVGCGWRWSATSRW